MKATGIDIEKSINSKMGCIVLGTLQAVGGAIQIGVGASLCATGVGAIIGAPLMLHGAADVVQGAGNTFYAAINSNKTMPNFMEEAYKYAGRGIGGLIGGKEGAAMGEKIAGGVFFVADIGMGLVSGRAVLNVAKGAKGTSFINGTKKVLTSYGDEMLKGAKGVYKAVKEIPAAAKKVVKVVPEAFSAVSKKLVRSIDNLTKAKPKVTNVTNNKQLLELDLQFFGGKADNVATGVSDATKWSSEKGIYSVGYEAKLPKNMYPDVSSPRHFQEANKQLYEVFQKNPEFAQQMETLYPEIIDGVKPGTRGAFSRLKPTDDVTWHHHPEREGVMQLVPFEQHTAKGKIQSILHPDRKGGMENWGGGR